MMRKLAISRKHFKLAKEHTDKGGDAEKFQADRNEAYDILKDPKETAV